MKNLTVMNKNGVLCVDSREVADIPEIEYKEFFRKTKGWKDLFSLQD